MKVYILKDPFYPNVVPTNLRPTVRVYPFDNKGRIGMVYYDGYDFFGRRKHYESVGGGLELNESKSECLAREALEEGGFILSNVKEFKTVSDVYGLIKQLNVHFYFTACITEIRKSTPTVEERQILDSIQFKTLEQWIKVLSIPVFGVNALVHQRELMMMKLLKAQEFYIPSCENVK